MRSAGEIRTIASDRYEWFLSCGQIGEEREEEATLGSFTNQGFRQVHILV
jgi:hypothetical protein